RKPSSVRRKHPYPSPRSVTARCVPHYTRKCSEPAAKRAAGLRALARNRALLSRRAQGISVDVAATSRLEAEIDFELKFDAVGHAGQLGEVLDRDGHPLGGGKLVSLIGMHADRTRRNHDDLFHGRTSAGRMPRRT